MIGTAYILFVFTDFDNYFLFYKDYYMNNNFVDTILSDDYDVFEGMTSISAVINSIIDATSDRRILKVLFDAKRAEQKARELKFLEYKARELNFELIPSSSEDISALTKGQTHGGIVAICSKRSFPDLNVNFLTSGNFFVLIEGVEDPYNFGYSVRSLYAAGVDGIVLPPRNWLELSGTIAKSSAGTTELARMAIAEPEEAVKLFKDNGFKIVCAGIRDSVSLYEYDFDQPVLLVVGGEKRGISRKIFDMADATVRIDYGRNFMGSLPSASAISVLAFEILRQKSKKNT
jgi:23S rRNA (guanosine2251-2'-O)-methyltransferase